MWFENPAWWAVAISLAAFVYTLASNRSKKIADKVKALQTEVAGKAGGGEVTNLAEKVDKLEDRTTKIETEMKHMPSGSDTAKLALEVTELRGSVDVLSERLKPVVSMAERIQEAMIQKVQF